MLKMFVASVFSLSLSAAVLATDFSVANMTEAQAKQFLATLQHKVKAHDVKAVSTLVQYPLRINHRNQYHSIANSKAFVQQYATIFTKPIQEAVLAQKPAGLFANDQGVMLGNGQLWFANYAKGAYNPPMIKIKAINQ